MFSAARAALEIAQWPRRASGSGAADSWHFFCLSLFLSLSQFTLREVNNRRARAGGALIHPERSYPHPPHQIADQAEKRKKAKFFQLVAHLTDHTCLRVIILPERPMPASPYHWRNGCAATCLVVTVVRSSAQCNRPLRACTWCKTIRPLFRQGGRALLIYMCMHNGLQREKTSPLAPLRRPFLHRRL